MAYSHFTLDTVVTTFQLDITESANLFADVEPLELRPQFTADLARNVVRYRYVKTPKETD